MPSSDTVAKVTGDEDTTTHPLMASYNHMSHSKQRHTDLMDRVTIRLQVSPDTHCTPTISTDSNVCQDGHTGNRVLVWTRHRCFFLVPELNGVIKAGGDNFSIRTKGAPNNTIVVTAGNSALR